jgi:UDP-N-acetylmuramate-alanine ligase
VERLAPTLGPGDVVITLGAGDVNRALSEIAERLRARG